MSPSRCWKCGVQIVSGKFRLMLRTYGIWDDFGVWVVVNPSTWRSSNQRDYCVPSCDPMRRDASRFYRRYLRRQESSK